MKNKCILIVGLLTAIIDGILFPVTGICFSKIVSLLLQYENGSSIDSWEVYKYSFIVFGIAFLGTFSNFVLISIFSSIG